METAEQSLSPIELAIVGEEEALLGRVQARLAALRAERQLSGDGGLRLRELRDEAATAHEEDLPALLDQLHVVRAVEDRRRGRGPLPEPTNPYFAHFRLRDGDRVRDYLLGHVPLLDTESGLRLLDWRNAPLSQLYYRFREGEAYEIELPAGRVEGWVEVRRAVVVVDGALRVIQGPQGRLELTAHGWRRRDEADLPALEGGSGSAQRGALGLGVGRAGRARLDVSALLDRTQFEIVHESGEGPLLVLGSAGSGKTTVALHRLAALHFQAPEAYPQKRLAVVVPEIGLSRLAVRLLEPLGLGKVEVETFTQLARGELAALSASAASDLPRQVRDDAPPAVARLKRHRALIDLLPGWLAKGGHAHQLESLRRELLTDRPFLRAVVAQAGAEVPAAAVEETVQRTLRQLAQPTEKAYRGIDADRLEALDGRGLDEATPDDLAQTLDTEDLPLLLALHQGLHPRGGLRRRAHLVLDEAQELSPAERLALRRMLGDSPSLTVAGDDVQRMGAGEFDGWDALLADLGAEGALRHTLSVSYRCPAPIARLAQEVLGPLAAPDAAAGRPGAAIGLHRFASAGPQILAVQDALGDLLAKEPRASIAVLTRTGGAAVRWAQALQHLPEARLITRGDFTFEPGIDICEVAEAKGLEFDYVVIPDADAASYPDDDDSRRTLHVAVTRAMHQLWLTHVGTQSPLIAPPPARVVSPPLSAAAS